VVIILFKEWVVISGKELKEIIALNKNLIIFNGYIFSLSGKEPIDDNRIYLIETEDDELVVSIMNGKEVFRKKGNPFY